MFPPGVISRENRMRGLVLAFALSCGTLAAETHEIYPDHHSRVFSAHEKPVLRVHSGDTVITKTWDSGGQDHTGKRHLQHPYVYPESGNPLMGPFYIEEAERGDALERSEEHTSELQSHVNLVCRLLLEKKKNT